jgi:polysaccharide export outer membrane protein
MEGVGMMKMKNRGVYVFIVVLSFLISPLMIFAEEETKDYIIGPGDVLDISVWKDETLTRSVVVLPDGKISFPLIGEVIASGKTVAKLKKEIEEKLSAFVPDVILSFEVKQVNSMLIYVIGRVNNPGRFLLNTNVNVLQALSMAGGLTPFAKRDKIKIFRHEGDKTQIFKFHYDDVVEGKDLEQNIILKKGDVVVVP